MKAVIYAAGRATRLGPDFVHHPKILIQMGGKSLLERHVLHLKELGIERVAIVTGHQAHKIREVLSDLRARYQLELVEIYNQEFTAGSALSMFASLDELRYAKEPVLLMDGDVLYHYTILKRLVHSPHSTVLLIDRAFETVDDDPVLVPIRNARPIDFVKKWKGEADELGESIGFFKVGVSDLPWLVAETLKRTEGLGRLDSYDDILRALVLEGRFCFEDVTGMAWTEIDFPHDLEKAAKCVLPAIQDTPSPAKIRDQV